MDYPTFFNTDGPGLNYVATHVFLPVQVPEESDYTVQNDLSLVRAACTAAHAYSAHIDNTIKPRWCSIEKMLDNLQVSVQSGLLRKGDVTSQLRSMRSGDILAFHIRAQRAAVIFRKQEGHTLYESFEVAPSRDVLSYTPGSPICSYPQSSIEVPNDVFDDVHFQTELAHFLSRPSEIDSDLPSVPASESQYITALLNGILRSVGRTIDSPSIQKRVRDEIGELEPESKENEWRRSSLWLLIRVVIQTSLDRSDVGQICYKQFLLFFVCGLAKDANNAGLSGDLLHLMSCKILRRLSKLGPFVPDWLSDIALEMCICLQDTLKVRATEIKASQPQPSYWNPSELDLVNDTRLSLSHSGEYIRSALEDHAQRPRDPLSPVPSYVRGTLSDFLSDPTLFDQAYSADPYVALYDLEQSVEESIDNWVAHVTDIGEASTQLGRLMEIYLSSASIPYVDNPEYRSIAVLTALELWVALDKLTVAEIPILADYSPEIPISLLESLLLRKEMNLHRLSLVYQYLSARHSRSRAGLSVLSDEFTQNSFPIRFYDSSPVLQKFKVLFCEGPMWEFGEGGEGVDSEAPRLALTLRNDASESLLSTAPLVIKAITFELQCPLPLHIWRSCIAHLLYRFDNARVKPFFIEHESKSHDFLFDIPELRPFLVDHFHQELPTYSQFQPAYLHPQDSHRRSKLVYTFRWRLPRHEYSRWHGVGDGLLSQHTTFYNFFTDGCPNHNFSHRSRIASLKALATYISNTAHTSNEVLATQTNCSGNLPLHEFIAFGHLRSGSSLQWVNILRELRGRTFNLRSYEVHFLFAQAVCQVGPLDIQTGEWRWHQELQNPSFCDALLTELQSLFIDIASGSLDHVTMSTISLLLTRLLASSPCESISERALQLLRDVRQKTLEWVQELAYNLILAPMQHERREGLYNMAATCRSTFDVDASAFHKLFLSAQDVDALFSCAFFTNATSAESPFRRSKAPGCVSCHFCVSNMLDYSNLHHQRDRRLSVALEVVLKDHTLADVSDRGIDLAICSIWPGYRPSPKRWEVNQHRQLHILTCATAATEDKGSQLMHINLLDESLLVDNQPLGGLPHEIRVHPLYQQILHGQALVVAPSDILGMDFATLAIVSAHRLHFSLRGGDLVIRAQHQNTNAVLELIPSEKLTGDLPMFLVEEHVHWLRLSESLIEVRPLEYLWEQLLENWQIVLGMDGSYRAHKGFDTLVDMKSRTWAMVSGRLNCLDHPEHLIVTTSASLSDTPPTTRLSVGLPCYELSFFVNAEDHLESRDFKGMIYDDNQCIGTLFGLADRLVLRAKGGFEDGLVSRQILVPFDFFQRRHTQYSAYYAYAVDTELGCLTGNSSLESKVFLAYLHAKTSIDWQPDPLTGMTGCQEALSILHSAGIRSSFDHFSGYYDANNFPRYPQFDRTLWIPEYLSQFDDPLVVSYSRKRHMARQTRSAKRAAYLFQPNPMTPVPPKDCNKNRLFFELELEDIVYTAASVLFHQPIDVRTMDTIVSKWTEMWGNTMTGTVVHPPSPYNGIVWNSKLLEVLLMKMRGILQENDGIQYKFQVLFLLPTVAYCSSHPQTAFLSMLLTLAKSRQHSSSWRNPQLSAEYRLLDGYSPSDKVLRHLIHASRYGDRSWNLEEVEGIVEVSIQRLLEAWPSDTVPSLSLLVVGSKDLPPDIWDAASMTCTLQKVFSSCHRNLRLKDEILRSLQLDTTPQAIFWTANAQTISAGHHRQCSLPSTQTPSFPLSLQPASGSGSWSVKLDQLLFNRPAPTLPDLMRLPTCSSNYRARSSSEYFTLDGLYSFLRTDKTDLPFREQYITDLHASALRVREECQMKVGTKMYPVERLEEHFRQCRVRSKEAWCLLQESLSPTTNPFEQALGRSGQWPKITVVSLLRCLATTSPTKLSKGSSWRKCLVSFVLLLLELQRSRRLLLFALQGLEEEFSKELENEGCDGWDAEKYPDWLLIQLQGNFLIRRTQADIAMEMMSPRSGESTVLQVNMGEGKSSVIIPIVAAALADDDQLVRVVVPKALMKQMFDVLINRLAGLVNRRIYRISFSRQDRHGGSRVYKILSECMEQHGIIVLQPEDILSLKLRSVEMQLPKHKLIAKPSSGPHLQSVYDNSVMVRPGELKVLNESYFATLLRGLHMATKKTISTSDASLDDDDSDHTTKSEEVQFMDNQKWHYAYSRDILDECDEILHPRFQLIYTVGHQQHMDGYPDRWSVTQQILRLVKQHAGSLSIDLPDSIEFKLSKPGSFPYFRILRTSDAGRRLILLLLRDVMSGHLPSFHFQHLSQSRRDAIHHFLSSADVDIQLDTAKEVEEYARQSRQSNLWGGLLLLRGLFACNILLFALTERRWRVDYGLIPGHWISMRPWQKVPTMLAVPYRAKDVPAPYTQFGHPDITILLTCLSYYYTGLSEEQLRISFQTLLHEDDPTAEYALWVSDCSYASLPPSLQFLGEFNLESSEQWDDYLYPVFSYCQAAIDFYLSRIVFPKEAKEFPWKIAGSSWDIAEKRKHPITGFSGTNDSRYLLPMSITQHDLDHQQGTSARILSYLLQPENDSYALITHEDNKLSKTRKFLKTVVNQTPEIRVILDVGAQILDVSNAELANEWLSLAGLGVAGAVFFDDEEDELMVMTKNRISLPLMASPLSQQLERCVIYLDDAHTRGTDLKFPKGFRAAVTLGPKVTKDRLVQGCMRMRKLGRGHSLMFFAPLEVDLSIRSVTHKVDASPINTAEILRWAIHETLTDIQERAPYWAQQGMSHQRRYDAWSRYCRDELEPDQLADAWLERDAKSLTDLYAPYDAGNSPKSISKLETYISRRCNDLGASKSSNKTQLDEQLEREVNREIEREREVELPPKAEPARHFLHEDVVSFVKTGTLRASSAFRPVFTALDQSSATTGEANVGWSPFILATADFCETIKEIPPGGRMDQYLRPVHWVISGRKGRDRVLVLVSPFEADRLMPDIRVSNHVHLHVYVPRTSERIKPADDLKFYSIPPVPEDWTPPWDLIDQLNIFAGQLYLRDYDSYLRLSHFLQIQKQSREDRMKKAVQYNLFNLRSREELAKAHPDSLLPSMMMLLAIRRRGLPFSESHMGKILQGQSLTRADFKSTTSTTRVYDGEMEYRMGSRNASPSGLDVDCDEDRSYVVVNHS